MMSPALAIGWTLWREHRWDLIAALSYLFMAGVVSAPLHRYFATEIGPHFPIAVGLSLPVLWIAFFLIGIGTFGLNADVGGSQSCFPARLFTLPVRTRVLAGWPLAHAALAASLLWLVTAAFILQPGLRYLGMSGPLWWPAALAAATVGWCQALLWLSYGLPWVRVMLATALIAGVVTTAQIAAHINVSEGLLTSLFFMAAAIGWRIAYVGVRNARCGDVPDWQGWWGKHSYPPRQRQTGMSAPRRREPFSSAMRAQVWFEWRRTGKALPVMTGAVLPFACWPILFGVNDAIPIGQTLLSALVVTVFLAGIAGTTVSGKNAWVKDYYGVSPCTATLPMTTAGLVAAKLKAAALSTLVAWAIVGVMLPLAMALGGIQGANEAPHWWKHVVSKCNPLQIVYGLAASVTLLIVWTWKRHVDSLFLGLTGRKWIINGAVFAGTMAFFIACYVAAWIYHHPENSQTILAVLPWLLGMLIVCRLLAAGCLLRQVLRRGLLDARTAQRWVIAWLCVGLVLFSILAWSVPASLVPTHYIALIVLFALPMARLTAAPLALDWNRHR